MRPLLPSSRGCRLAAGRRSGAAATPLPPPPSASAASTSHCPQLNEPHQRRQLQQLKQQQQPQTQAPQQQLGRRTLLAALCGAAGGAAALVAGPFAARAAEPPGAAQQRGPLEEYMELEGKGKLKGARDLDNFRARFNIRRGIDGRVQLRSRKGEWFSVRVDMEVAGALLLRSPSGDVYAIETQGLPQVDLSDDYVVLMLFADGTWQDAMQAVEYEDEDSPGTVRQLNMSDTEFREFIGLLKGFEAEEVAVDAGKGKGKKKK